MSNENTKNVFMVKNQNNSKELFIKWNINNKSSVTCANRHCTNDVDNNAFIVYDNIFNKNEYIIPICMECYENQNNIKNQSTGTFSDLGSIIMVDKNLLLEYNL